MSTLMPRRTFFKAISLVATGTLASGCSSGDSPETPSSEPTKDLYDLPLQGKFRVMHTTDIHAQLTPVYFREPNVNLGVGVASDQLPHIVGNNLVNALELEPDSLEAYAYTCVNFEKNARQYGRMGGAAHIKSLYNKLRESAGGKDNTLTFDGGDLWQGSGTALWTRGRDMVDVSNMLGVDVMTGHWEFTYNQDEVLANLQAFNGDFVCQNIRIKEDSLFDDAYFEMVEKYEGLGLHDEDNAYAFAPYTIKTVAGFKVAVIGQAFPRTANANPPGFIPDWSFGIREDELNALVDEIQEAHSPNAIVLLSHNGMDVDIKLASRVRGISAIFGGHTHDGIPKPIEVTNLDGETCLVTNAGSNGKFVGVMDFDIADGKVSGMRYQMLPVFENLLPADQELTGFIGELESRSYDQNVIECRNPEFYFNQARVGKDYKSILDEPLAKAGELLYRRGNFMGTWDQLICDALHAEYEAQVVLSPGFRWGTSILPNEWITMRDLMTQCAMTYGETYGNKMKGNVLKQVLEQVADNLFDPDPYLQSGGDMVRVSGINYSINPTAPLGERVYDIKFENGDDLQDDQEYLVSGWAVVGAPPEGRLVWDIVRDYILANRDENNVIHIPKVYHPAVSGVQGNLGIEDYDGKLI